MAEAIESERDQAEALLLLGGTYRNMGDNQRAFEIADRSLNLFLQANDLGRVADAHNNIANICFDLGRLGDARVHYEAGAEIKQAIGDIYGQGLIACNLGEVFRVQGEIDAAIAQYGHALVIYERIGSRYMMGVLHMNLGAAHLVRGDLVSAAAHLRPSTDLFLEIGSEDFLPELERYQAELELRRGNLSAANIRCEQALTTAMRLEARAEEGITRRLLAEILASAGSPARAWNELALSQAILREAASPHELARTLLAIAMLAPSIGKADEGHAALNEAIPTLEEVGALRDLERARAIAARYTSP
jgi:tetratricopeptide (TPR) repeat protein